MPDITAPEIVNFVSERIRPMAERLVGDEYLTDDHLVSWFGEISTHAEWVAAGNDDVVIEGNASDSDLTKGEITSFVTQMLALQTQWNGGGVAAVIHRPAVRSLGNIL